MTRQEIEALLAKATAATPGPLHMVNLLPLEDEAFYHACSPDVIAALCRRALEAEAVLVVLRELRRDANRLCDRQLGGTYEEDCRVTIAWADAALEAARDRAPEGK